jgi:HPt (histidine-containing phosphotransfer) domain-containing protein
LLGIAGVFKLVQLEAQVKQLHEQIKINQFEDVIELIDQISNEINNMDF